MGIYGISKFVSIAGVILSLLPGMNIVGSVYYGLVFLVLHKRNKGALNTCIFYMVPIFICYVLLITSLIGFRVVEPYKNLWKDNVDGEVEEGPLEIPTMQALKNETKIKVKRYADKPPQTCTISDIPFMYKIPDKWDKVQVLKYSWIVGIAVSSFNMFYLIISTIIFFFAYKFLKKMQ
ncbi:hypothetical protein Mgra_00002775 [Meloidogyne graminicola]|uniref:Uncharacterized protein n=1 Tax=Meloidogyne graminicola TaxID=189291 RepID=A0A8S9ZX08_9BILA|nr:hypothetical protein Mgra_00002775 [Meloidogyne graminicola]